VELSGYDQLDARVVGSGTATLKGPYDQPVISGDLSIISGVLYIEEIGRQAEIVNPFEGGLVLIDTIFAGDGGGGRTGSPFVDNMIIDLRLNVEHDTWLRSEEMKVEIEGDTRPSAVNTGSSTSASQSSAARSSSSANRL
jgi:hypothetical protein